RSRPRAPKRQMRRCSKLPATASSRDMTPSISRAWPLGSSSRSPNFIVRVDCVPADTTDLVTSPQRVVRSFLIISGLFTLSASVIWGVSTLFLLDSGLNIFQVFIANSAFTVGTVLFEITTGVVADTTRRRSAFLPRAVTLMVGTLAYVAISVFEGGLLLFCLASIVLGIGF